MQKVQTTAPVHTFPFGPRHICKSEVGPHVVQINGSFQIIQGRRFYVIEGPGIYRRIPA